MRHHYYRGLEGLRKSCKLSPAPMYRAGSFTVRITMSNPEGPHPEYFEELCALAASGQISEPEFVELQDHMRDCARCRSAHADFIDLLHSKLPLVASERIGFSRLTGFFFERSSYRERFMARARKQGLAVSKPLRIGFWRIGYAQVSALAMALLLVAVGFLGYALRRSNARNAILAADLAAMRERVSQPGSPQRIPAPLEAAPTPPLVAQAVLPPVKMNNPEFDKAREAYAAAEARSKAVQEQLQLPLPNSRLSEHNKNKRAIRAVNWRKSWRRPNWR